MPANPLRMPNGKFNDADIVLCSPCAAALSSSSTVRFGDSTQDNGTCRHYKPCQNTRFHHSPWVILVTSTGRGECDDRDCGYVVYEWTQYDRDDEGFLWLIEQIDVPYTLQVDGVEYQVNYFGRQHWRRA